MRGRTKAQGLPHVYRGRARRSHSDIYDADHAESHAGGRFRWLVSTFLAAAVGAVAIGVAIFGSLDGLETGERGLPRLKRARDAGPFSQLTKAPTTDGLKWNVPKVDRLQTMGDAQSAKHIIRDNVQVRKDGRPFVQIKPYMRVVARLAPVPTRDAELIPAFNPFKLYATQAGSESVAQDGDGAEGRTDVAIRVVDLLAGILPAEDGQELDAQEVADLVNRAREAEAVAIRPGFQADGAELLAQREQPLITPRSTAAEALPSNTTILPKTTGEGDDAIEDLERSETRVVRAGRGDTLLGVLQKVGADKTLAAAMVAKAAPLFANTALQAGQEVHITLVPSLTRSDRMEPARLSVYADGHNHKLSISRDADGEFVAKSTQFDNQASRAVFSDNDAGNKGASLYSSLYHSALVQGVPPETINQILRIHAYETDFRKAHSQWRPRRVFLRRA